MPASPSPESAPRRSFTKPLLLIGLAIAGIAFHRPLIELWQATLNTVASLGAWGPLVFIALYAAGTVALIPGSVLTLFAGAAFGVVWGSIWTSIAATLGASLSFLISRYFARAWATEKMKGFPIFAAIDDAVAQEGWKIVGLTRLSPIFPFALLNYGFGITKVSFRDYVLASWIGMMPGTVLYVYVGSVGKALAEAQGKSIGQWIFFAVGLLATLAVTIIITRRARQSLRERL